MRSTPPRPASSSTPTWSGSAARKTTADGYVVEVQIPLQTLRFSGGDEVQHEPRLLPQGQPHRLLLRVAGDAAGPVGVRSPVAIDLQQPQAAPSRRAAAERHLRHQPAARDLGHVERRPTTSTTSARAARSASRPASRSTAPSIPTSARSKATRSRCRSTSASRCSSPRSGRSSWRAWASSTSPAPAATATCAPRSTRGKIVDPIYGSKLTGTIGKTAFGVLNAVDDSPTPPFTIEGEPFDVANKVTTVGRATYGLGRSDYAGGIFTHTLHDGRNNLVAGGDISMRPRRGAFVVGDVPHLAHDRSRRRRSSAATPRRRRTPMRPGAGSARTRSSTTTKTS